MPGDHGATGPSAPVLPAPYRTVLKPYGRALADLARGRPDIVCLSGDLTRQCEIDLFQAEFPDRFIHAGMAEANMIGVAGALARSGLIPFVHTFGVFATRRPLDQIVNAVAYPRLPVRIVGFMPGVSSPGGPSHQAIEDVALMRALPGMTVLDVADVTETAQAVAAIADLPGPVYLRLKRGEIPVIFPADHPFSLTRAQLLGDEQADGTGAALVASGMMVAPALAAASALRDSGVRVTVLNVPVIKPLDTATVLAAAAGAQVVITIENHSVIGGLGSAVAEALAEAGLGRPLRRIGLADTFADGALTAPYLFARYGLTTQQVIDAAWTALSRPGQPPRAPSPDLQPGDYAPV
ncbi:MAG: transketolase family protein [Nocardiopsaceae bacterium]|jgi:transketolase|nr:transketolase family protein [Nocardiopsaceae bacterium]